MIYFITKGTIPSTRLIINIQEYFIYSILVKQKSIHHHEHALVILLSRSEYAFSFLHVEFQIFDGCFLGQVKRYNLIIIFFNHDGLYRTRGV